MPAPFVFMWGAAGGGVVAVLLYVAPEIARDLVSTGPPFITGRKVVLMVVMVVVLAAIAGVVALTSSDSSRGQAILDGLGIQASLRGVLGAVQQGIRPGTQPSGANAAAEALG